MKTALEIIENFNPVAIKIDNSGCVLLKDQNSTLELWMDVWVEGEDTIAEWNMYIFNTLNDLHVLIDEVQSDCNVFDLASSEAIQYFERNN